MIKLMIVLIGISIPIILIYLNINHPVEGGIYFSIFILMVSIVKIWESFFTSKEKDRSRYHGDWTLVLTSFLYFLSGIFILVELFYLSRNIEVLVTLIGIFIFTLGTILRRWSIKTLGNQWGIHAVGESKLISSHRLIISGPYKYIRHPIYVSYILDLLGIALVCNSYYSIIFIFFINVYSYIIRAKKEELSSLKRFGDEYTIYMKNSSFMIPFLNKK